jgi:hypothetical protein
MRTRHTLEDDIAVLRQLRIIWPPGRRSLADRKDKRVWPQVKLRPSLEIHVVVTKGARRTKEVSREMEISRETSRMKILPTTDPSA